MVLGELDSYMQKKWNLSTNLHHTKINSRWIKDLNISHDIIKVLDENIGGKISNIPCSNIFTDMSPRARVIKERISKKDLIKIKSFYMAKENSIKIQREPTYGKIYLQIIPQTRVCSPKYIKNSHDSTPGRQTIQFKKWAKDLNRYFSIGDKQRAHTPMKSVQCH